MLPMSGSTGTSIETASHILARMGPPVSDAIRMLLTRITTHKTLPFDIYGVLQTGREKS